VTLLGRGGECALLDALLAGVRRGESRSLVVRGEAGIGKTALLEYLIDSASDLRVVRAVGVESEMELGYASLQQLCDPLLALLARLPGPQRQALETVFGLSAGAAPDRFLVGLGALGLIAEAAGERPLLCVVDDAQWLDKASAQALAFVARRLLAEPVGIVFAARERAEELGRIPELEVRGVRNGDARTLLSSAVRFKLDDRVRDRIIAETRGNPLALLELPRGLTATQLAVGFGPPPPLGLSGRIEESFVRQVERLPDDTRLLLLLAAAEPVGDPLLLWRAAERLGIAAAAAEAADARSLVEIDERVIFRHPLVRSAVYRAAAAKERRRAHLALAEVTDQDADPDRRAWHLAASTAGTDELVAVELERSAGRAQARGGVAAAAAFLQRSVALTQDPTRRADRALAAAQASLKAGMLDAAVRLLATAEAGPLDEPQLVRIQLLRAQLATASSRGSEGAALWLAAARRLEVLDLSRARETYLGAMFAALNGARLNRDVGVHEVAQTARAAPRRLDDNVAVSDLMLDALVALEDGYDTAVPACRKALDALAPETVSPQLNLRWLLAGSLIALELWDDERAHALLRYSAQLARETGTLGDLPSILRTLAPLLVFSGDLSAASSAIAETASIEDITGARGTPYGAMTLEAWRGRPREARQLIETTMREAGDRGEGIGVAHAEYARAVLCNGLGEYEEAVVAARSASEYQEVILENYGLSELIEPATRIGQTKLATDALDRLARKASATGTDWALGIEARSRALLRDGDRAEHGFRSAIDHLSRTRLRAQLARTHLLYGEWLRREQRRVDAREHLRAAHSEFTAIGMEAFAERARVELLATGERARKRTVETRDDLTAQERQIAEMARDGLSNPEIGARLFLSARTVEWHLRKVFGKLGIRSRHELANALSVEAREPQPPGSDIGSTTLP
jgi:DNA-binding CsgD family transcriptional regulator